MAQDQLGADVLLPDMKANVLLADKAFEAGVRIIKPVVATGTFVVIPSKANRATPRKLERRLDATWARSRVLLQKEQFSAIAARCDKTAPNYLAAVDLTVNVIWLN